MPERDSKGRFVTGHSVSSPGRPKRDTERQYLNMLIQTVTSEKWQQIVDRAVKDAIAGNFRAREWIGNYLIGKPAQAINLDASSQALLLQLMDMLERRSLDTGEIFKAMIAELATEGE